MLKGVPARAVPASVENRVVGEGGLTKGILLTVGDGTKEGWVRDLKMLTVVDVGGVERSR